ncbi:synaptic vesicle glycoprotein 2B-like isoform X3 [Homalodisca vitripennis]|uniref:synaptic vesicle glycoprotein 2B-like isoform X3 n=1 Tax=Homalodisca vitripennis TaxID=197043 RepID=UPI001EEB045C|nr:synaptic vesicle glycoprotein 2B-like isoform X3 [Homalodisca vitripennis]
MPVKQGKNANVAFEDAMDIAGYGKFSMFIIILAGLAMCTSLLGSVDVSFILPAAECDLKLSSKDKGLLSSAFFIGTIAGSHLSGYLADTLGRRYVLMRGLSLNVLFYILGTFAPNYWSFFIVKVASGILCCPAMIATVPLLGEFVPSKRRAQSLLICTSLASIGLLYSALIGWLTLQASWKLDLWFITFTPWRLFFLLCGVPSVISSLLFCMTPESPKFMLTRGKSEASLKILQRVHSVNSGKILGSYPVESVKMDANEVPAPQPSGGKGVMPVLKHICDQTLPLFKPPFLKNLVLCVILMVDICLCVNTIFLWLPEITNRMAFYKESHEGDFSMCEMVTKRENLTSSLNTTSAPVECNATINTAVFIPNVLISLVQPIIMLAASVIVPLFDRRHILSVILILCGCMAFLLTVVRDTSIIIMLFGGMPILSGVCYNVLSSILIELFPTYIRAMAVSVNMICGRLGAIIGSQVFCKFDMLQSYGCVGEHDLWTTRCYNRFPGIL